MYAYMIYELPPESEKGCLASSITSERRFCRPLDGLCYERKLLFLIEPHPAAPERRAERRQVGEGFGAPVRVVE